LKESLYPDVLKVLIEVDTSEVAEKDAQKILEEAAAIAEKRIRETESREP
jgi:Mg2+/Co2+ transporter CorC